MARLTKREVRFLKENYRVKSDTELASELGVDKATIVTTLKNLGLERKEADEEHIRRKTLRKSQAITSGRRPDKKGITLLAVILIISVGVGVYANSFNNKFVYDDEFLIEKNYLIKEPSLSRELFTKNIRYGIGKETNVYRPLQMISYWADYRFWRLDPKGYHITNTLIHVLAALVLYFLIRLISRDQLISFLTALFFVCHPVHSEAVAYISGRADPMSALFILSSFYFYIRHKESNVTIYYAFSLLMYTLALFSKESSLIFLFILLMYDYVLNERTRKMRRQKFLKYPPFVFLSIAYLILRINILAIPTATKYYVPTTLAERTPGIFSSIADYFRILIIPFNLHMEYVMHLSPWFSIKTMTGIIIVVLSIIAASRYIKRSPLVSFSICWFFINFIPVSNIFALNAFMAEHWMYLPSIGFFLLVAYLIKPILSVNGRTKLIAYPFLISALSFYSCMTIYQNGFWKTPIILYKRILEFSPYSSRVHNSLGAAYYYEGRYKEAEDEFRKAIEIKPTYADPHNNLGHIYLLLGQKDKARIFFEKAVILYRRQNDEESADRIEPLLTTIP